MRAAIVSCLVLATSCPRAREASPGAPALPPEARPAAPRVLFAAALLGEGGVRWRGWLHADPAGGPAARLPEAWRVPYDARVVASPGGVDVAWLGLDGSLGLAGPSGAREIARDADPNVPPVFAGAPGELFYARRNGDVVLVSSGLPYVLVPGDGPVRGLVLAPDRRHLAFVRRGVELVVADRGTRRTAVALRARGRRPRLFSPRFLSDGTVLVRERDGSRATLWRLPPRGGPPTAVPLPPGTLRAFSVTRDGRLLVGMAARRGDRMAGSLHVQALDGTGRRTLAILPGTLPFGRPACDGKEVLLVDEGARVARLVAIPIAGGAPREITGPAIRVRDADGWALVCP